MHSIIYEMDVGLLFKEVLLSFRLREWYLEYGFCLLWKQRNGERERLCLVFSCRAWQDRGKHGRQPSTFQHWKETSLVHSFSIKTMHFTRQSTNKRTYEDDMPKALETIRIYVQCKSIVKQTLNGYAKEFNWPSNGRVELLQLLGSGDDRSTGALGVQRLKSNLKPLRHPLSPKTKTR